MVTVWIDEVEIKVGDSLIMKIRDGIDETEFFGNVISPSSVNSNWVQNELAVAMNQQINERIIKDLPILFQYTELLGFLVGKLYADFSNQERYYSGLQQLVRKIMSRQKQRQNNISAYPDIGLVRQSDSLLRICRNC